MIRAPGSRGSSAAESRADLQSRLTVLFQLMFWCFLVLMAFLWLGYSAYPSIEPARNELVYGLFGVGLVIMAVIWRVLLVRRELSLPQLHAIDGFYAIGTNTVIAACAVISIDQRPAAYTCLVYACYAVLTRALVVPSTGTRTTVVTSLAMVPMTIAAIVLAAKAQWPGPKEVPGPGFFVGYIQIAVVAVLLSAFGSRIIYGLRRQISAAQQLGQYTLGRQIGQGGMGAVYLAHHLMLRRPTAVKLLPPSKVGFDNLRRFEREVQIMSQLTHPNTVAVFDYGHSPDGVFYYAMEYLGGGIDLDHLVRRHGRQPAERVRRILIQVCGALQEAHERGLIHRDIKPANIILCQRGAMPDVAKVVDFGLVKEPEADTGASMQVILGTPGYVAPETVTDPRAVSLAADLYALGAVGYFLLTGRRVFEGETAMEVCIKHVTQPPVPPSVAADIEVPAPLEALILRCLEKQPAARHASASALAEALEHIGPFSDWSDEDAHGWWQAFRPVDAEVSSSTPTVTIALDVARRERRTA